MSLYLAIIFSVIFALSANAQQVCLKEPTATSTKEKMRFLTPEQWQDSLTYLQSIQPAHPGDFRLIVAYGVYVDELPATKDFKVLIDKKKHCHMGCRIAAAVSYETAAYSAWLKEYDDLTDCKKSSTYDLRDLTATVKGANYAKTGAPADRQSCFDWCDKNITKADLKF